ncbi:MAG: class I SAM-dependent methyltransferase [Synoicihabitans sp.]
MPENRFIGEAARGYDRAVANMSTPERLNPVCDCLVALAEGGNVLEFAVGTGRVAIPLAQRGVEVTGIELSADMLAAFKAKPEAAAITAIEGDMATTQVDGEFSLVYLVFNTITNLTTQREQVACFENAARHLRPGGRFVIENVIPALRQIPPGATSTPFAVSDDYIGMDEFTDLTHKQLFRSRHLSRQKDGRFDEFCSPFRYAWPAEMDLMARIAGMTLEHRWADWTRAEFTGESVSAISVWRLPE